mmetsp:Transcript_29660/g.85047  ORF Transcript_29660/g.85047 Transcript_29660/m.85047 type:complete len:93 (+) Transcript_29660:214-492(+)
MLSFATPPGKEASPPAVSGADIAGADASAASAELMTIWNPAGCEWNRRQNEALDRVFDTCGSLHGSFLFAEGYPVQLSKRRELGQLTLLAMR